MVKQISSSFRDPAGFIFRHEDKIYRQINVAGIECYDKLISSGLYAKLTQKGWLISHEEVEGPIADKDKYYRVIQPELVPFVSHPFEWSFGQLKDAALLTLDIQLAAIEHGLILKDASAYNVQFLQGRPVFIDTLSFDIYREGQVWEGYRQFCQHFLAPLVLMARCDIRFGLLSRLHIDGIPLDLCSKLLPRRTWLRPGILMHLHLHARAQAHYADSENSARKKTAIRPLSKLGLIGIVTGLRNLIQSLRWQPEGTEWADYYQATNYSDDAFITKKTIIESFLDAMNPRSVWDLGANTGHFSRLAADRGIPTVAFDIDPAAVEIHYRQVRDKQEKNILPLVMDLTNPSTALGWAGVERESLIERGPVDCGFALALIHHLAISNNVPLEQIAVFFTHVCQDLIIEFVPKADSQVRRLLSSRKDIFPDYHEEGFLFAFKKWFEIKQSRRIEGSERTMYWMTKKQPF